MGQSVGVMFGVNFSYRVDPGAMFLDIRGLYNRVEYEFVQRQINGPGVNRFTSEKEWAIFKFSAGYEIPIFRRR